MARLIVILAAVGAAVLFYYASAWRSGRMLERRSTPMADPTVGGLTRRLARTLEVKQIPLRVYEVPEVNALATPEGRVYLTRGMMDRFAKGEITPEEIAAVISHELGHVAMGHAKRRMMDFAVQNLLIRLVLPLLPFGALSGRIAGAAATLIARRLSRRDEFEADAYATALMEKAGFGPAPLCSLLVKISSMGPRNATPAWLLSHPKTEDRIAAIRAIAVKFEGDARGEDGDQP